MSQSAFHIVTSVNDATNPALDLQSKSLIIIGLGIDAEQFRTLLAHPDPTNLRVVRSVNSHGFNMAQYGTNALVTAFRNALHSDPASGDEFFFRDDVGDIVSIPVTGQQYDSRNLRSAYALAAAIVDVLLPPLGTDGFYFDDIFESYPDFLVNALGLTAQEALEFRASWRLWSRVLISEVRRLAPSAFLVANVAKRIADEVFQYLDGITVEASHGPTERQFASATFNGCSPTRNVAWSQADGVFANAIGGYLT